jgi:hypothetical protein
VLVANQADSPNGRGQSFAPLDLTGPSSSAG